MNNVYNKSNVYFVYEFRNNWIRIIGDKQDLLGFLASNFTRVKGTTNDIENFENDFFENLSFGKDYEYALNYYKNHYVPKYLRPERYMFFDGMDRIIDVKQFKEDAFKAFLSGYPKIKKYSFKKTNKQNQKSHTGVFYKSRPSLKKVGVKKIDSLLETEFKDYHFKPLENKADRYPKYWDDETYHSTRRVSNNWKNQYKVNKQHNIHNSGKDDFSIRKNPPEYFSDKEIDRMLYEDFCKKK